MPINHSLFQSFFFHLSSDSVVLTLTGSRISQNTFVHTGMRTSVRWMKKAPTQPLCFVLLHGHGQLRQASFLILIWSKLHLCLGHGSGWNTACELLIKTSLLLRGRRTVLNLGNQKYVIPVSVSGTASPSGTTSRGTAESSH